MEPTPEELAAFTDEGLLLLDRPLSWEIVGELLAALSATEPNAST